ncbi:unnamed protein product [Ostreobium quekettii]|uniref:RIIa domain-containing protein n=1 Tax=Ostreobium quekettii TaxID=121088 RepID=A0A8S1J9T8_9CHLO|nr:unnamed protein product [Ostreobium quekettii]
MHGGVGVIPVQMQWIELQDKLVDGERFASIRYLNGRKHRLDGLVMVCCLVFAALDHSGFSQKLQEALALILEKRPKDPLAFLAAHFHSLAYGGDTMSQALCYVCLNQPGSCHFADNISCAYSILERGAGGRRGTVSGSCVVL